MKKFTDKLNESVDGKLPTAYHFLKKFTDEPDDDTIYLLIEFAKIHVEACKKEIIEKIEINDYDEHGQYSPDVDRDSILNAYPLENIK